MQLLAVSWVSPMTVRERIAAIHAAQLKGESTPTEAAQWLATLGALIGNVLAEIREAEAAYARVYADWLDKEAKANLAKIRAELTPEFARVREARDTLKQVEQQIGTLKYLLRAYESEERLTR
jgi:hypothetical protein